MNWLTRLFPWNSFVVTAPLKTTHLSTKHLTTNELKVLTKEHNQMKISVDFLNIVEYKMFLCFW